MNKQFLITSQIQAFMKDLKAHTFADIFSGYKFSGNPPSKVSSIQKVPITPLKPKIQSIQDSQIVNHLSKYLFGLGTGQECQLYLNLLLLESAKGNMMENCLFLLSEGWRTLKPDPNFKDKNGFTALHIAAEKGYQRICEIISNSGLLTEIDVTNQNKQTSLHIACKNRHAGICLHLIKQGASVNIQDYLGNTPLHYAALNKLQEAFRAILESRPDLQLKNLVGQTAMDLCVDLQLSEFLVDSKAKNTHLSKSSCEDSGAETIPIRSLLETSRDSLEVRFSPLQFQAMKQLGRGSFGEVFLVTHMPTGELYAMKIIRKRRVINQNLIQYAITERNVLSYVRHPFIVSLKFAFQSQTKLYLVIDYCRGGDLNNLLNRLSRLPESSARMYLAELTLALEQLHELGIVYRDLKPENVVIDAEGHVKLIDFGLCKEGLAQDQLTESFCGSLAYLPPEILNKEKYGKSVDWYLLGVLFYEMLVGIPPYYAKDKDTLFTNIRNAQLRMPNGVSPQAENLLRRLLDRDPTTRITVHAVKQHPFFNGVDWGEVRARKLPVPQAFLQDVSRELFTEELLSRDSLEPEEASHLLGWSFMSANSLRM